MSISILEFTELEKRAFADDKSFREHLAPQLGKAYVIAITRDGCPACEKQKPRLDSLARIMFGKHGKKIVFTRIHISRPPDSEDESLRSKDLLGHYFYPTNLILIRTRDRGAVECYRSISPRMSELKRNIEACLETATALAEAKG